MGDKTKIEWTDATWNPVTGCTKVSQGCKYCYAEREFHRPYPGRDFTDVRCHPERLSRPLHWRRPRKIFVNSMSDLFHENVPDTFIAQVFMVMEMSPRHTFQVLTKRPECMRRFLRNPCGMVRDGEHIVVLPNVWLGVSVENQKIADERIPVLLESPAAGRFVSYEPALGPVDFSPWLDCDDSEERVGAGPEVPSLDWVIAGGESGPNARPSHPDWFRCVRDQCHDAGVAFFFKQWGEWRPESEDTQYSGGMLIDRTERCGYYCDEQAGHVDHGAALMRRAGKRRAGRLLDGVEHSAFPQVQPR